MPITLFHHHHQFHPSSQELNQEFSLDSHAKEKLKRESMYIFCIRDEKRNFSFVRKKEGERERESCLWKKEEGEESRGNTPTNP